MTLGSGIMYCHHCGAQLSDNAKFCTECGARITNSQQSISPIKKRKVKKPIIKRWWFWALIVFALIIALSSRAGETSAPAETARTTAQPTPTPTAEPTPEPTPEHTPAPVYAIGDTVTIHDLEFTVNSFTFSRSAGGLGNLNPSGSDYVYCVIYVTVYNPTNEEQRIVKKMLMGTGIPDYSTDFVYDGEYQYNSSFADYTDFLFANETILPLGTLNNKILNYRVPNEVQTSGKPITLKIYYSDNEYAIWQIR